MKWKFWDKNKDGKLSNRELIEAIADTVKVDKNNNEKQARRIGIRRT